MYVLDYFTKFFILLCIFFIFLARHSIKYIQLGDNR